MNAGVMAEWFRRQGYRVIRTPSSYWVEASARVYQAFPYHWLIEPSERELNDLLLKHNAIALRYSAPLTAPQGKVSYHVVCEDPAYDLATLPRQTRQNVRKGLEYATVEPIPLARLAEEGWRLRLDTLSRQGRAAAESEAWWRRLCMSAVDLPGFEAWGALHDGQLTASFLSFTCDDCFTLPHEQSASAHLEYRVNNAIFYSVIREALGRPGISGLFFCLQSLDAPASVDEFKFRMGCTAKPVRQRVAFHPLLAPLIGKLGHAAARRLMERYPSQATPAKLEGMLRFHLEGKCAPSAQQWPECLASREGELQGLLEGNAPADA